MTYLAQYQAFGNQVATYGSTLDRQKCNSKDTDPTGLVNEGMRYFDLLTETFITKDPAGMIDGPNEYTYVNQNPWTKFDPMGLDGTDTSWIKTIFEKSITWFKDYILPAPTKPGGEVVDFKKETNPFTGITVNLPRTLDEKISDTPPGAERSDLLHERYGSVGNVPDDVINQYCPPGFEGADKILGFENALFLNGANLINPIGGEEFETAKVVESISEEVTTHASSLSQSASTVEKLTADPLILFHGTTKNAANKILQKGFKGGVDDAVFFGDDFSTSKLFGQLRMSETGASSGLVLRYTVPQDLAESLGLTTRHVLGEFRGARPIDLPGASGFERILNGGENIDLFNQAVKDGSIGVKSYRINIGE